MRKTLHCVGGDMIVAHRAAFDAVSLSVGDTVSVRPGGKEVMEHHPVNWNASMDATVGQSGKVTKVDASDATVEVEFGAPVNKKYWFSMAIVAAAGAAPGAAPAAGGFGAARGFMFGAGGAVAPIGLQANFGSAGELLLPHRWGVSAV